MSAVQTAAARPYGVSLAIATASSALSKVITDSTGPKISSWAIFIALLTPSKIVGSTYVPPVSCRMRLPPATSLAPSVWPDSM
ncbi:hypothetical protein D3C71_1509140 [compost metagenome]